MKLLKTITKACDNLKAENIKILDMREISPLVDYMVICTGRSDRQVEAIVKNIREEVYKTDYRIRHIEGLDASLWVLIDCYDIICHVFQNDERIKYSIEKIWGDVPRIALEDVLE